MKSLHDFDNKFREEPNTAVIAGVDEVGRGPLAGPVVVAAVVLPPDFYHPLINDSKKLNGVIREKLDRIIRCHALDYALDIIPAEIIDDINIRQATLQGMRNVVSRLKISPRLVLVDGERVPDLPVKQEKIIKGDAKSLSIASASIIAKVLRDNIMKYYALIYENYGFGVHKGYGTEKHRKAILEYGPSPIHRKSFLKNMEQWR